METIARITIMGLNTPHMQVIHEQWNSDGTKTRLVLAGKTPAEMRKNVIGALQEVARQLAARQRLQLSMFDEAEKAQVDEYTHKGEQA